MSVMFQAFRDGKLIDSVGVQGGDTTSARGQAFAVKSKNKKFTIPIGKGTGYNTGIAWVYDGQGAGSTPLEGIIKFVLHDRLGVPLGVTYVEDSVLDGPPNSNIVSYNIYHKAEFISEMFPDIDYSEEFIGSLSVEVLSGYCYVMALRVDVGDGGNVQLTSMPVVGEESW